MSNSRDAASSAAAAQDMRFSRHSLRRSMRSTLPPYMAEEGGGEAEGSPSSDAAATMQRRSTDLAQSMLQRRSLLGSAQSSVASSIGNYTPSMVTSKIDNRPAIVLEIGTRLTRIGFAGDFVPQEIFRTEFVDPMDGLLASQQAPLAALFDRSRTERDQYEMLVKFFKNIIFRKLLTSMNSRRVVVVESLLTPNWQRNAIARALFECPSLCAHSILFAPSHLCCTFPFNTKTCLVIDLGANEAIAEGILMLNSLETSTAPCASALEQNVRRLVAQFGRLRTGDDDPEGRPLTETELEQADRMRLWEDVAVRFCFATTAARGKRIQSFLANPAATAVHSSDTHNESSGATGCCFDPASAAPAVDIPFGSAHLLTVPGIVREGAAEVLFSAGDEEDVRSVTQMILDSAAKTNIDLRRDFLRNLLLVGGATRLPGFFARLKSELLGALADGYHPKLSQQLHDIRFYQFPGEMKGQLFCAWLGGAMFGAFDHSFDQRSLSRDEWMETRVVPDVEF